MTCVGYLFTVSLFVHIISKKQNNCDFKLLCDTETALLFSCPNIKGPPLPTFLCTRKRMLDSVSFQRNREALENKRGRGAVGVGPFMQPQATSVWHMSSGSHKLLSRFLTWPIKHTTVCFIKINTKNILRNCYQHWWDHTNNHHLFKFMWWS